LLPAHYLSFLNILYFTQYFQKFQGSGQKLLKKFQLFQKLRLTFPEKIAKFILLK